MKKCAYAMMLFTLLLPALVYAQTDTVDVPDFFASGEGTLNTAISDKITAGTLSNTVFRLKLYGLYVLNSTITVPAGSKLTLIAPDPGNGADRRSADDLLDAEQRGQHNVQLRLFR